MRAFTWVVVVVLFAATAHEAAIGLEWIPMGSQPGDEARGQAAVTMSAFLALVAGMGIGIASVLRRRPSRSWPMALVPVAAATYLVSHFYAFDSYYLPTLRRFSEDGNVAARWVYGVAVCALATAVLIACVPRVGLALLPFMLLVCGVFVIAEGIGH